MDQRSNAITEIRTILEKVAQKKSAITYSELVSKVDAIYLEPDSELLAQILDEISSASNEQRGCMLSAVVIHKGSDELPGPGFFALAKQLGRNTSDKLAFHVDEIRRVHESFGL
jgi:hypothetical protein